MLGVRGKSERRSTPSPSRAGQSGSFTVARGSFTVTPRHCPRTATVGCACGGLGLWVYASHGGTSGGPQSPRPCQTPPSSLPLQTGRVPRILANSIRELVFNLPLAYPSRTDRDHESLRTCSAGCMRMSIKYGTLSLMIECAKSSLAPRLPPARRGRRQPAVAAASHRPARADGPRSASMALQASTPGELCGGALPALGHYQSTTKSSAVGRHQARLPLRRRRKGNVCRGG